MSQDWRIDPVHSTILKDLLVDFDNGKELKILDLGSGRTSLSFLTNLFKNSIINAIIYPGDERKKTGIINNVKANNYVLEEIDINNCVQKSEFDIVLAHLFLGEAKKFSKEPFSKTLDSLFKIRTKYLAIVEIANDPSVDYALLSEYMNKDCKIIKNTKEEEYIGFLIQKNLL